MKYKKLNKLKGKIYRGLRDIKKGKVVSGDEVFNDLERRIRVGMNDPKREIYAKRKLTNKSKRVFAFIDSQNLNLAIRDVGWHLDFGRFLVYLKDKYHVQKAFLFIGYVPGNEALYTFLQKAEYIVIFKPTLEGKKDGQRFTKGNVDAELVLHSMIEYPHYDKAIIVSGDGDFYCLIEHLEKQGKLGHVLIPNPRSYSALLRKFRPYFIYIDKLQQKLEKRK